MTRKKNLLIIGASGFIGTELQKGLINYNISTQRGRDIYDMSIEDLADKISDYEIVINLAGKSIFSLWTRKNKKNIYRSRIETTERIAKALNICDNPPEMYIQASAIGIYKPETLVSENNHLYDQGFMAKVVYDWEKATELIDTGRVEVTILRFGIVLGREGGAYKTLRLLTRFNLGGYFDGGKQALSFIWVKDLISAVDFIMEKKITGVVNIVSPEITTYKELMMAMRKQLKPLIIWSLPSFVLKLILGEVSEILLKGQKVIPDVMLKNSFNFEASDVNTCVKKLESS